MVTLKLPSNLSLHVQVRVEIPKMGMTLESSPITVHKLNNVKN